MLARAARRPPSRPRASEGCLALNQLARSGRMRMRGETGSESCSRQTAARTLTEPA
ncbi:hypothetical protein ACFOPN_06615 [Xanthomonas hyacinthi]|uniref:hypothetical protein n=1 Tax=Xanthomonas hyacinthi TaxID=56455 RepID=UPI0036173A12